MPSTVALRELTSLLGAPAVRTDPDEIAGHLVPWRGERGDAAAVVRPADTDQVRHVVAWARRHRVSLLPQGANTGLVGASTPPAGGDGVVLSTDRLRAPLHVDPTDRTAVVGAGVRLSELNRAAASHGLCLPIDLAADPSMGGMVATNTGGARMLRHGDLRRSLLGLRAVLADEDCSVVDELTTLHKHNVGPSIGQLLVGSGGALGIVTEVAVQLTPLPVDRATAWVAPHDTAGVLRLLGALEDRPEQDLSAFEVVSRPAMAAALGVPSVHTRPFGDRLLPEHSVLVELEGPAGAQDRLAAALDRAAADGVVENAVLMPADAAWSVRHAVTEGLARRATVVGLDVSVPRGSLPDLVAEVRLALARELPRAEVADFGHWGDGGVHCNVCFPHDGGRPVPPDARERSQVRELVLGLVVGRFDGSFSAEHGIGPANAEWWLRTTSPGTRALVRSVAAAADPLGILGHPGLPYRR